MDLSEEYSVHVERIRSYRLHYKHWSQAELAAAAGLSDGQISRIEQEKHRPRPETLRQIADALEVRGIFRLRPLFLPLFTRLRRTRILRSSLPLARKFRIFRTKALHKPL